MRTQSMNEVSSRHQPYDFLGGGGGIGIVVMSQKVLCHNFVNLMPVF
jgi:hypothetical protein